MWAERKDTVFLTIEVADVTAPEVKVEDDGHVTFSGTSDGKHYAVDLHLAGALLGSESKVAVLPRHIVLALTKAAPGPHWGKLLAQPGKAPHYVKVDWAKYKDEDEEEAEGKGTLVRGVRKEKPTFGCSLFHAPGWGHLASDATLCEQVTPWAGSTCHSWTRCRCGPVVWGRLRSFPRGGRGPHSDARPHPRRVTRPPCERGGQRVVGARPCGHAAGRWGRLESEPWSSSVTSPHSLPPFPRLPQNFGGGGGGSFGGGDDDEDDEDDEDDMPALAPQ